MQKIFGVTSKIRLINIYIYIVCFHHDKSHIGNSNLTKMLAVHQESHQRVWKKCATWFTSVWSWNKVEMCGNVQLFLFSV